jgi:hypothetical protein
MRVTLTKISPTRLHVQAERTELDGSITPLYSYDFSANSLRSQTDLAERLGIRLVELTPWIAKAMESGGSEGEVKEDTEIELTINIRGLEEDNSRQVPYTSREPVELLKELLANTSLSAAQPVLKWKGQEVLCCVDIDYHQTADSLRPTWEELRFKVSQIRPLPVVYHPSHGHGAKLYYFASKGYTANELAAAGALSWLSRDGRATAELKCETRHPLYDRSNAPAVPASELLFTGVYSTDLEAVARMFAQEVSSEAVEEYLRENNLEIYKKYPHEKCPISRQVSSHGEPVYVGDNGIYCHKCSSAGITFGNRKLPGFVPYTAHFVHWNHAVFVLSHHYRTNLPILRLAYRCALKLVHGVHDPRVEAVFDSHATIARIAGEWLFVGDKFGTTVQKGTKALYTRLPVTWMVSRKADDTYKIKIDPARVDDIAHPGRSLEDQYGYTDLKPIKGMQMWGKRLPYSGSTIPIPDTFSHLPADRRPKYIDARLRDIHTVNAAYAKLEEVFPGIDRNYLELLVAMRGLVESGKQNVFIIVTGATRSAKTSTNDVAAGLMGDKATVVVYNGSEERLRQSIASSISQGSFTVVDELFKKAEVYRQSPRQVMDPILTLTDNSVSHKLYVGPVPMSGRTVYVVADIDLPYEVRADAQISRRVVYVHLTADCEGWRDAIQKAGISKPSEFRLISPEHADAANILCSYWIDKYFDTPKTIDELLRQTGYTYLEHSNEFGDPDLLLKLFYEQICKAEKLNEQDATRVDGQPGWKKISNAMTDDLRDIWDQLADGLSGERWRKSRRLQEPNWSVKLRKWYAKEVPIGTRIEFRYYKDTTIFVRFRLDSEAGSLYNENILTGVV